MFTCKISRALAGVTQLSIISCMEMSLVQFLVRAHAQGASLIPSRDDAEGNKVCYSLTHPCFSLSPPSSLPKINKKVFFLKENLFLPQMIDR